MAVFAPIYKDTVYTYNGEELDYRIETSSGVTIVEGVASVRPDGTPAQIYVNRLCEPFLAQKINPTVTGITQQPAFDIYYLYDNFNDELLETYVFLRMYSGDWDGYDKFLSDPIKPNVSKDMTLPVTVYLMYEEYIASTECPYFYPFMTDILSENFNSATTSSVVVIQISRYEHICYVPATFDPTEPDTIPADRFYGKCYLKGYNSNLFDSDPCIWHYSAVKPGSLMPSAHLDNPDGLIKDSASYWDKTIQHYDPWGSLVFFVTPNTTGAVREATFTLYAPFDLGRQFLGTLKIIQPAN